MKPILITALLALGLVAACAGVPEDSAGLAGPEICREAKLPGSNIIKRECRTEAQWAQLDEEERARNVALYGNSKQDANPGTFK